MILEVINLWEIVRVDGKLGVFNVNRFFFFVLIMEILLLGGKLKREEYL